MKVHRILTTEKASRLLEQGYLMFEVDASLSKPQIKEVLERTFGLRVKKVQTLRRKGKKVAYVKVGTDEAKKFLSKAGLT